MISNVVDLHRWRISIGQFTAKHALKAWRSGDQYDFMAVEYFPLNPKKKRILQY